MNRYVNSFVCDPIRAAVIFENKITDDILFNLSKKEQEIQQEKYVECAKSVNDYLLLHTTVNHLCRNKTEDFESYTKSGFEYNEFCRLLEDAVVDSVHGCDNMNDYANVYYSRIARQLNTSWKMKRLLRPADCKLLPCTLTQLYEATGTKDKTFTERLFECVYKHPVLGKKNDGYTLGCILYAIDREMSELRKSGPQIVYNKKRKREITDNIKTARNSDSYGAVGDEDQRSIRVAFPKKTKNEATDKKERQKGASCRNLRSNSNTGTASSTGGEFPHDDWFQAATTTTLYIYGRLIAQYAGHVLKFRPLFPDKDISTLGAAIMTEAAEILSLPHFPPHLYLSVDKKGILPIDLAYNMMLCPYSDDDLSKARSALIFMLVAAYTPGVLFHSVSGCVVDDSFNSSRFWSNYIRPLNEHVFGQEKSASKHRIYETKCYVFDEPPVYKGGDSNEDVIITEDLKSIAQKNLQKIIPLARDCVTVLCKDYDSEFHVADLTLTKLVEILTTNVNLSDKIISQLKRRDDRFNRPLSSLILKSAYSSPNTNLTSQILRPVFDCGVIGLYVYYHVMFVSDNLRRDRSNPTMSPHSYIDLMEKLYGDL